MNQVWQEEAHPEAIFTERFARQKMDYIHMNPVRAGLVEAATEWPYSSARAYFLGEETYSPTVSYIVDRLFLRQLDCRSFRSTTANEQNIYP